MSIRGSRLSCAFLTQALLTSVLQSQAFTPSSPTQAQSAARPPQTTQRMGHSADPALESGSVSAGVYRNKTLGFSCNIPVAWVLRTEEMNVQNEEQSEEKNRAALDRTAEGGCPHMGSCGGRVLLAAFSRPPEAAGEDVNSSILIAAESVADYPGLKEAVQYLGPVSEVAKAQGFKVVEEPYEFAVGMKRLVREDFQKDVGTRVMRQSTLVMLARGYAVSFTFIGGTEDEVEELVQGLSLGLGGNTSRSK